MLKIAVSMNNLIRESQAAQKPLGQPSLVFSLHINGGPLSVEKFMIIL